LNVQKLIFFVVALVVVVEKATNNFSLRWKHFSKNYFLLFCCFFPFTDIWILGPWVGPDPEWWLAPPSGRASPARTRTSSCPRDAPVRINQIFNFILANFLFGFALVVLTTGV
jgi:hypothetical protein